VQHARWAEPGEAEAQSCAALAGQRLEGAQRSAAERVFRGERFQKQAQELQPVRNPFQQPAGALRPWAEQKPGAGGTAPRALLPACAPKSPSSRRQAWRHSRGRSWDDCPVRSANSLKARAGTLARNSSGRARPHSPRSNSSGSCLPPDSLLPVRRESVYS